MKPARNTRMIETSAATAYTTMMIEGGISMPRVPAPASEPSTSSRRSRACSSSGSATFAMVAQVAAEEPDTVPKIAAAEDVHVHQPPGHA